MSDSSELDDDILDFEQGTGYGMICKNRPVNTRGYSTGGVAIVFRTSHIRFKEVCLPDNDFEILAAEGSMPNFSRKFIAICAYMPPNMSSSAARGCLDFLVDVILNLKSKYKDPFIAIGGDFNDCLLYTSPSPRD